MEERKRSGAFFFLSLAKQTHMHTGGEICEREREMMVNQRFLCLIFCRRSRRSSVT